MSLIGYARVSTSEQNLERQIEQLKAAGVTKIFQEKVSGRSSDRPALNEMLAYIREDDEVVISSLDRLGRSSSDLTDLIEEIRRKGASLNILDLPSFNGVTDPNLRNLLTNLIVELYKYSAQKEVERIHERQAAGIAVAKKNGVYKGKPREYSPTSKNRVKRRIFNEAKRLLQEKEDGREISMRAIARYLDIAPGTLYRIKDYIESEGD